MRRNGTFQGIYDLMNNGKAANPLSQIAVGYTRTCNRRPGFERKKLDWNLSASNTVTVVDDCTLCTMTGIGTERLNLTHNCGGDNVHRQRENLDRL